jgi:hypothetical protein
MSRCAFCGSQKSLGSHFFAHRYGEQRVETVKVCEHCEPVARQAGYQVAEREPRPAPFSAESGTTPP